MRWHKGFARVDLAVTLLCAAFLVITLGAVGNRGRRRAQQLVCASQLGKWGQAILMHSADNGDEVMSMLRRWGDPGPPFPHYMGQVSDYDDPPYGGAAHGEWNLFEINPYIGAFSETYDPLGDPPDCGMTRLVACPSTDSEFVVAWNVYNCEEDWGFIEPSYSYWGRSDLLENDNDYSPNAKRDLTGATFSGDRLLMSDILTIDSSWGALRYNHGLTGWAWGMDWATSAPDPGHDKFDGEQDATGRNQLFGDGRVQWRPISLEFEDNLPSQYVEGPYENEWNGPGSGWVNPWDVSYY